MFDSDPFGNHEPTPDPADTSARCPGCRRPLGVHVGGLACVVGTPRRVRGLYDLDVFSWALADPALR